MKKNIHPQYFDKVKVKCACGHSFEVGSTRKEISTEICSNCHPFYTGKEKLIDTASRIEKFRKRREKASQISVVKKSKKRKKTKEKKKK